MEGNSVERPGTDLKQFHGSLKAIEYEIHAILRSENAKGWTTPQMILRVLISARLENYDTAALRASPSTSCTSSVSEQSRSELETGADTNM